MTRSGAIKEIVKENCEGCFYIEKCRKESCGYYLAIKALEQQPKTGHWIDKEEKTAVCSRCNRNNLLYGDFCKWCGAKMESEEI